MRTDIIQEIIDIYNRNYPTASGELEEFFHDVLNVLHNAKSDWISVKDKLPDNSLYVLVTYYDLGIKDYCISMGAYHAKENVWVDDTFTKIVNVTAWMPLPQKPESEGNME